MTEDVRGRIVRAVEQIEGKPGVRLEPPASAAMLDDAERRLGRPLPDPLRALLSVTNGLSVCHGLWRILGIDPTPGPDLVEFNRYDTWKYAWPNNHLDPLLVYELTHSLHVWAFTPDGKDVDCMLQLPNSIAPTTPDLITSLERGWVKQVHELLDPDDQAILKAVGPVRPDQGVYLGTQAFISGNPDPTEVRLAPLEDMLRMSGGLEQDATSLPPGTVIAVPYRETDEQGRDRWRWVTDRDLPGLKQRLADGEPLSHITIDGQIPGNPD